MVARLFTQLFRPKYLFIYLSRHLDQETAKRSFRSLSQAATCYYQYQSNHSKVGAIPLSALHKDTTSELARLSSHYPFNAER